MTALVRNENDCTSPVALATAQHAKRLGTAGTMIIPLGTIAGVGLDHFHHGPWSLAVMGVAAVAGVILVFRYNRLWRQADREELAFRKAP